MLYVIYRTDKLVGIIQNTSTPAIKIGIFLII